MKLFSILIINLIIIATLISFLTYTEEASASGPTNVSGIISSSTIWTEANSPYIVTGNILVEEGVNLTIKPGVTVKFHKNVYMKIDGTLFASGTESKMITFTGNKTLINGTYVPDMIILEKKPLHFNSSS